MRRIKKIPFWKREKYWEAGYEQKVLDEIVNPINKKIAEFNWKSENYD